MVCSSLVELCLSYIAKHIEKWTCIITDFHIKESKYLITDMSRLPQDLVARLINQLIVCKKLSLQSLVLFLDDQLQRIELPSTLTLVNDLFLKVIARLSKNLVSLKLGSCTKLQQIDGLTQLSSLQQLDLINCKANRLDDTLKQVFQQCQLTTLNLQNTPASDKSLSVLATHCSTLLDLNLSQTSVTSLCLSTILSSASNLRRLNLEGCFYIGNEAFDDLSTETNSELQELNLAMCDINDNSINKIVVRYIDLKGLFLQGCPITDLSMKSIARSLSQLNILRLNNITAITDGGIIALARAKMPIRMLDLSFHNITDKGLEAIAQNFIDITKLILDDCINITDRGLVAIASNCPSLRILSVVRCSNITDAGVGPIITSCNKLQNILLDALPISRVTVSTLSKSNTLQFVSLASCPRIKMGTELTTLCRRVKTINLNNCSKITIQDYKQLQGTAKSTQVMWK